jgi:hypothetical protein
MKTYNLRVGKNDPVQVVYLKAKHEILSTNILIKNLNQGVVVKKNFVYQPYLII